MSFLYKFFFNIYFFLCAGEKQGKKKKESTRLITVPMLEFKKKATLQILPYCIRLPIRLPIN